MTSRPRSRAVPYLLGDSSSAYVAQDLNLELPLAQLATTCMAEVYRSHVTILSRFNGSETRSMLCLSKVWKACG
jgi:hypothetical protein